MGANTNIEWCDATVNFWVGCEKVSSGCKNCYMFAEQTRYGADPKVVRRCKPATFDAALKWAEPKRIFTCSWSDFFIEDADDWRDDAWDVIRRTPQHAWQILTKRPERILDHLPPDWGDGWANVWLGTSVEDERVIQRVVDLLKIPAKVHFLSCEPLLSEIQLPLWRCLNCCQAVAPVLVNNDKDFGCPHCRAIVNHMSPFNRPGSPLQKAGIDWVIVGGESGPNARPMHPDWARSLRDQCLNARVPFFFKQHGEFLHESQAPDMTPPRKVILALDTTMFYPVGKKAAGRLLDGRTWDELPEVSL